MVDPTLTAFALAFIAFAAVVGAAALAALVWALGDLRRDLPVVVTVAHPARAEVVRAA